MVDLLPGCIISVMCPRIIVKIYCRKCVGHAYWFFFNVILAADEHAWKKQNWGTLFPGNFVIRREILLHRIKKYIDIGKSNFNDHVEAVNYVNYERPSINLFRALDMGDVS